MSTRIC